MFVKVDLKNCILGLRNRESDIENHVLAGNPLLQNDR